MCDIPQRESHLAGLIDTLELMLAQLRAYERAIPMSNIHAHAALDTMAELTRQALNEARDLATSLAPMPSAPHPFTSREHEVLRLVAQGLTNKEIAYRLFLSERTIQFHLNSIFGKSNTTSRTEAVALALQRGWLGFLEAV